MLPQHLTEVLPQPEDSLAPVAARLAQLLNRKVPLISNWVDGGFQVKAGEVVLLVPLAFGTNVATGTAGIAAKVSWLECQDQCVPGSGDVQAGISIGTEEKISAAAAGLAAWQKKIPAASPAAR